MNFHSFARFFGLGRKQQPHRRRRPSSARPGGNRFALRLEALEDRCVPAHPTIVASGVLPTDGTTQPQGPIGHPFLQVEYSEVMQGTNGTGGANGTGAADVRNYLLIDAQGHPVTIDQATMTAAATGTMTIVKPG